MFQPFCSDQQYEEELWPLVWEIEVLLVGAMMVNCDVIRDLDEHEVSEYLSSFLYDEIGFPPKFMRGKVERAWVERFLKTEAPYIKNFAQTFNPDKEIVRPDGEKLAKQIKGSEILSAHLENNPRTEHRYR